MKISEVLPKWHYEIILFHIYWEFYHQKTKTFRWKILVVFIFVLKTGCVYLLEPPRRGGSNEYPQSMFLNRNKKNNLYSCKLQFYYYKWGLRGSKLYRHVFVMNALRPDITKETTWTYESCRTGSDLPTVPINSSKHNSTDRKSQKEALRFSRCE